MPKILRFQSRMMTHLSDLRESKDYQRFLVAKLVSTRTEEFLSLTLRIVETLDGILSLVKEESDDMKVVYGSNFEGVFDDSFRRCQMIAIPEWIQFRESLRVDNELRPQEKQWVD